MRSWGAHYTDREKIMQIVEPVVVRPWLKEWEKTRAEIGLCLERADTAGVERRTDALAGAGRGAAARVFGAVAGVHGAGPGVRVGELPVPGASCAEGRGAPVQLEAESMGLQRAFPAVGPANVKGIEINPYAAELARVSVWIGEIQWMRRNGFSGARDPILEPLETIECRDAILAADGGEPAWPEADAVIGNPPFLGGKLLRAYWAGRMWRRCSGCTGRGFTARPTWCATGFDKGRRGWWRDGKLGRAGLVATNSIRGGRNRAVLERIVEQA